MTLANLFPQLDLWIAYYARLKKSVRRYESQDSMQHFTNVQIMCKDPYYSTTAFKVPDAQAKDPPQISGRKRKAAPNLKKSASVSCEVVPPLPKKATRSSKSVPAENASPPPKKNSSARSSKASNTDETTQDDEVIQDSPVSSEVKSGTPSPSQDEAVSDKKIEETTLFEHASTPNTNDAIVPRGLDGKAQSATSPAADALEIPLAVDTPLPEVASSQALVVVPLSSFDPVPSAAIHPSLSALLLEGDALLLNEFAVSHEGFLLSESAFPLAFMKLVYSFFADFLRFMRAHSYMDLLSVQRNKVLEDLKSLRCLGFNGEWLDELFAQFDRSIPSAAFDDLQRAQDAVRLQEQRNSQLSSQIEALKLELSQGRAELDHLNAKCKEIVDARVGLDVNFRI